MNKRSGGEKQEDIRIAHTELAVGGDAAGSRSERYDKDG
jgi:hypothetical protein